MSDVKPTALRLAFREEGDWWKCYVAEMNTMDDAQLIGQIHMAVINGDDPGYKLRKEMFIAIAKDYLNYVIVDELGVKVDRIIEFTQTMHVSMLETNPDYARRFLENFSAMVRANKEQADENEREVK